MGAMFRSEEMALCQMFIQPEAAYSTVSELGEAGTVQFRDLNSEVNSFQRKFVNEVRRCDEMERKLRYVEAEINKDDVAIPPLSELPVAPNPREIIDLEARLEKTENEIMELSQNAVNLKSNFLELTELLNILEKTEQFFAEQEAAVTPDMMPANAVHDDGTQQAVNRGRLGFVAGVIQRARVPAFERMLWRISRGNVFLRRAELDKPLEDPTTGNEIYKTVFVAFFQGEELKTRLKKVCTGFHASLYPCPSVPAEREDMLMGVKTRLADLKMVLNQTHDHRHRVLVSVAKELMNWKIMVRKMKAIYHTMNLFNMDVTQKCLIGECWVPVNDLELVQKALTDGSESCGSSMQSFLNVIPSTEAPPTFNRTNKFTQGFQNLINSYGIASYREANPALYTIITFPFLFGVMFGDIGHGLIILIFAAVLVINEKKLIAKNITDDTWNIFFSGRYIMLLMGIFSMYTGFIYNDIFSISINIFGSGWSINYNESTVLNNTELVLDPKYDYGTAYPIGLDPVWQLSTNKIIFLNSFKMKLSIIFGVIHMIFGVTVAVINHVHFKRKINILLEFLPQLLFLVLLFAYMVFMMFLKWVLYSAESPEIRREPTCAPSVLIMFINMMLFKHTEPAPKCEEFMFPGQNEIQMAFIAIALACVPVMLLGKPFYIMATRKRQGRVSPQPPKTNGDLSQGIEMTTNLDAEAAAVPAAHGHGDHDEEPMSEIFIHQAIHTIEYVLSTVSHTASYLRLWALSLAHAQLSEVMWMMILRMALKSNDYEGSVMIYFIFYVWSCFSLVILVMMEGLSAFLHTLRLHWVEFMSKFYEGLGYLFTPFCFKTILDTEAKELE
ncbi:V-type proton ATPase 116 kDa subunit a-like isoform X2 [Ctenocephalides felis]|uniref:V-type proton ATPase 116 kDa subunit a-like isoform X2 n=1 Tax=Ctenocephalides felis TaxID=7515 RepID=UPI000E6E1498|nr:V-type proton ATPase 116 kDa subunit a-like isoform X2 [Ctenocephalides felis]